MNKNSGSPLIYFIQLVCVFYHFTGSADTAEPPALMNCDCSHFMKEETKAQWSR